MQLLGPLNLPRDERSLKKLRVPKDIAGFDIEQALHIRMRRAGHERLRIGTDNSPGTTNEVFRLNRRSRAEIDAFLLKCFKEFIEFKRGSWSPPPPPPKAKPVSPPGPVLHVSPDAFVRQVELRREAAKRAQQESEWRKKSNANALKAFILLLVIVLAVVLAIAWDSSRKPVTAPSVAPTLGKAPAHR